MYSSTSPSNVLTCARPSHAKPKWGNVIKAAENWIPGLSMAGLGVNLSLIRWMGPAKQALKSKDASTQRPEPKKTATAILNTGRAGACARCAHGAPQV